jgi:hypothetical protein
MVGPALIEMQLNGRPIKVVCCIMEHGDCGEATFMVGNRFMWQDHWDATVDIGESSMVIRNADDGEGKLCVPIDLKVNHADVKSAQAARVCCAPTTRVLSR